MVPGRVLGGLPEYDSLGLSSAAQSTTYMACDHVRSLAGGSPPLNPLAVVLWVASLPAKLLAEASLIVETGCHPVPAPPRRVNVADAA